MGEILNGTASWTDPTLLASGWYPDEADSAEARLRFYATRFPLVEVDSTYYSLPSEHTSELWVERTPDNFTFDIKAFRLFTGHPTPLKSLPKRVREVIPSSLGAKKQIYSKDLPKDVVDEVWDMFRHALMPLHAASKLGAIFLQFPKWFFFSHENLQVLAQAKVRLPDYKLAVEFRQPSWLDEKRRDETLRFLRESNIAYTSVDEPQGTSASVPPIAEATTNLAVVRFHGRRGDTWDKQGVGVEERFKYLYGEDELAEWVPKIENLSGRADEVHVLMNNCYADFGVRNAVQLATLLTEQGAPVRRAG